MEANELRVPRDVVVHLYRRAQSEPFLMLRRTSGRGGFWQGVSGAPLVGETDQEAAAREVLEETGFEIADCLFPLDVTYAYRLDPARQERWTMVYGARVQTIQVSSFAAEVPDRAPRLDPEEHDRFRWCSFREAHDMLDWPVESDVLSRRRLAIERLRNRLA